MYKEDESSRRTARVKNGKDNQKTNSAEGQLTPRSSGPVKVVKPHGLLLQYLINTLGIYLRNPKGRALRIKTASKTKDYSRPPLTKPKISSDQDGGRGCELSPPGELDLGNTISTGHKAKPKHI